MTEFLSKSSKKVINIADFGIDEKPTEDVNHIYIDTREEGFRDFFGGYVPQSRPEDAPTFHLIEPPSSSTWMNSSPAGDDYKAAWMLTVKGQYARLWGFAFKGVCADRRNVWISLLPRSSHNNTPGDYSSLYKDLKNDHQEIFGMLKWAHAYKGLSTKQVISAANGEEDNMWVEKGGTLQPVSILRRDGDSFIVRKLPNKGEREVPTSGWHPAFFLNANGVEKQCWQGHQLWSLDNLEHYLHSMRPGSPHRIWGFLG
ncbi:hypothetical protein ISF_06801 [Cordyceps fumosorosea ARSEF 2679]|uniref:Uncharacterized protein n=1 Tax=Cordyceps fumosorosea (strain ARSEF 2679) TaxID=1081104 RepID=A0A167R4G5_CORFA|nr:hypothetical protein ISF_06801 [Cordyceps fumosorosea ARSEF 2679]OAA58262.1 hypothetical protein ISF_06801 [Cordyceps fumosorosea ARSEF 2679]